MLRRWTRGLHRQVRPEVLTLHRALALVDGRASEVPAALATTAAALAGATTLTLQLAAGTSLRGTFAEGSSFTVGGITYLAAADAVAAGDRLVVTLDRPLEANVAAAAHVDLLGGASFTLTDCIVELEEIEESPAVLASAPYFIAYVPIEGAPTVPKFGDHVTRELDGTAGHVTGVPRVLSGSWQIHVGPRKSRKVATA